MNERLNGTEKRAPWFRTGWMDYVKAWITKITQEKAIRTNGSPEKVKESDLCIILRIPTEEGDLYFKAVGPSAVFEASLSEHLNSHHEGKTVEIIDIEPEKGWLLMKDIKGKSLRELKDKSLWKRAISEYGRLQVKETSNIEALLSVGVTDRRMNVLKAEINKHLEGMCDTGLNEEETVKIMALKPELLKMCDEMEGVIPYSIEHGDLHSANIRLVDDEIIFFDWGDATVTHPFFSTRVFWHSLDELIASESEWINMVNEFKPHYLEQWAKFAPMEELERLLLISDQLSCVYRGLSWYLYITPSREDVEDSYKKPAQWLQVLLEHRALLSQTT